MNNPKKVLDTFIEEEGEKPNPIDGLQPNKILEEANGAKKAPAQGQKGKQQEKVVNFVIILSSHNSYVEKRA